MKTWEYNSDNTLIKNTFLYWDIKETWSYEYDDKGNLVKETFTRDKSDEMNCQLAGTWVTIYEYDKSGNMLKETTIGNGETEIIEYAMIDVIVGVT